MTCRRGYLRYVPVEWAGRSEAGYLKGVVAVEIDVAQIRADVVRELRLVLGWDRPGEQLDERLDTSLFNLVRREKKN